MIGINGDQLVLDHRNPIRIAYSRINVFNYPMDSSSRRIK